MRKLELLDVGKAFITREASLPVVEGISLHLEEGEFVSLLGPSGCGKSTIFNMICGLVKPDAGKIMLNGAEHYDPGKTLGYMPQQDLLLPWRKTIDNVILSSVIEGRDRTLALREALELMPLFGLEGFENSYPSELSGGMRQRAALMRTVLAHRDILLLDEPFGALDAITRAGMQSWLLGIWERFRLSILFVTHDVDEALFLSDRIYVLTSRPGRVNMKLAVDIPRPRSSGVVTSDPFTGLKRKLLQALEQGPKSFPRDA